MHAKRRGAPGSMSHIAGLHHDATLSGECPLALTFRSFCEVSAQAFLSDRSGCWPRRSRPRGSASDADRRAELSQARSTTSAALAHSRFEFSFVWVQLHTANPVTSRCDVDRLHLIDEAQRMRRNAEVKARRFFPMCRQALFQKAPRQLYLANRLPSASTGVAPFHQTLNPARELVRQTIRHPPSRPASGWTSRPVASCAAPSDRHSMSIDTRQ